MMSIRNGFLLLLLSMPLLLSAAERNADSRKLSASDKRAAAVTFSARYKSLSLERAYQLQKAYVRNRVAHGVTMVGFKAGLTTQVTQETFSLSEPITGVLIEPPLRGENIVLMQNDAHALMVEQELAFRVVKPILQRLDNVEQLKNHIDAVAAAVELPDLNFVTADFTGLDIIANNAMVHKLIVGEWQNTDRNIDGIRTTLYCGDRVVAQAENSIVLDGQWQTLLWMVNHLLGQGYMIQSGHVLLTGAMNGMHPAQPCNYSADFSGLGNIRFSVQ